MYKCTYTLYLWAKLYGKIPSGKWFSHLLRCREISNGRHFEIVRLIFDFFAAFRFFFGVLYQWLKFQRKIRPKKYVSDVGSIWTPPLTTNGRTEDLDHLSVKFRSFPHTWVLTLCDGTRLEQKMLKPGRLKRLCKYAGHLVGKTRKIV